MRFRKLRIAWSVVCGIACVLLLVLWVRSYWNWDCINVQFPGPYWIGAHSLSGIVVAGGQARQNLPSAWEWWASLGDVPIPRDPYNSYFGFGYKNWGLGYFSVYVPYWFLALGSVAAGIAPWRSWPRSFSLRTLLIATTLVAIALGLIMWTSQASYSSCTI